MTKKVNHKELREVIKKCYAIKQPLHILGGIGIGKSDSVRETAREIAKQEKLEFSENHINSDKHFCFIDIRVSQLEPSDLRGLPSLQDGYTKWLPPNWLPKKAKGIIFFDELQLSPPSIQASCYQLILDRRLGDYKLPDGYHIISADNRTEDRANIFEMAKPLCNRFCHIELQTPDVDEWQEDWAFKREIDNRILIFLKFKPENLFRFDSKIDDMAFPTPRMWEKCSNLIKDIESDDKMMGILTASAVGEGTSIEFCAFLKLERKVKIDDILKKPEKVKEIKEIDLKYALLSGLTQRYKKDKKVLDTLLKICNYLEAEFGILLWRFCYATNKSHFGSIVTHKKHDALIKKYGTYLV